MKNQLIIIIVALIVLAAIVGTYYVTKEMLITTTTTTTIETTTTSIIPTTIITTTTRKTTTTRRTTSSSTTTTTIEETYCNESLEIKNVTCSATNNNLKVVIENLAKDILFYDFTVVAKINSLSYTFTGDDQSLKARSQITLNYECDDVKCPDGAIITSVKVKARSCPGAWFEKEFVLRC